MFHPNVTCLHLWDNTQFILCDINNIISLYVKQKTEAFLPSRWPGGALKEILYLFCFLNIQQDMYHTCF